MITTVIAAIAAFDIGILAGAWWGNRERDKDDNFNRELVEAERDKETAKRLMEGL